MKNQLLETLENSKNYTLKVAELMPENAYGFKPVAEIWNFKELIDHIAYGIQWWEENYIKGNKVDWNPPVINGNKNESIANLTKAYQSLKNTINNAEINQEVINGFYATLDHITHHRGQAIIYLRSKGIAPPEYVF